MVVLESAVELFVLPATGSMFRLERRPNRVNELQHTHKLGGLLHESKLHSTKIRVVFPDRGTMGSHTHSH